MTERLSDVEARIETVHQLSAVITAMRGVAAARSREAHAHVDGIRAYANMIGTAIGDALAFLPESERPGQGKDGGGRHAVIALCAEQGFAGAFNEHVLDAAETLLAGERDQQTELLLVGDRGLMVADERGLAANWSSPMIVHAGQMTALAGRITEALYERLDAGHVARVTLVHAAPDTSVAVELVKKQLVPFDFSRFPLSPTAVMPIINLPSQVLLEKLAEEYIFAELCEAVMLSFAAENEVRMRAMIAARANVADTLDKLLARSRQLRQEEITSEIAELSSGAAASKGAQPHGKPVSG
jgi:F-type H+-transporting ATPase subunit gamma